MRKVKATPYGKHTGKDINGLPKWNQNKYEYCPYSSSIAHKTPNDDDLLVIDDDVIELYNLLKEQFDRVVYIISKTLQIQGTATFWEAALSQFIADRAYCYPGLTDSNLPFIFAYRGLQLTNINGVSFKVGSEAYITLLKHSNLVWKDSYNSDYKFACGERKFLRLQFRFYSHKQEINEDGELDETMIFAIDDMDCPDTPIFKATIHFDQTFLHRLISKKDQSYRNSKYHEIANSIMNPICAQNN